MITSEEFYCSRPFTSNRMPKRTHKMKTKVNEIKRETQTIYLFNVINCLPSKNISVLQIWNNEFVDVVFIVPTDFTTKKNS